VDAGAVMLLEAEIWIVGALMITLALIYAVIA
jgi:hypothetical protein